jgi:hypothetical protein
VVVVVDVAGVVVLPAIVVPPLGVVATPCEQDADAMTATRRQHTINQMSLIFTFFLLST